MKWTRPHVKWIAATQFFALFAYPYIACVILAFLNLKYLQVFKGFPQVFTSNLKLSDSNCEKINRVLFDNKPVLSNVKFDVYFDFGSLAPNPAIPNHSHPAQQPMQQPLYQQQMQQPVYQQPIQQPLYQQQMQQPVYQQPIHQPVYQQQQPMYQQPIQQPVYQQQMQQPMYQHQTQQPVYQQPTYPQQVYQQQPQVYHQPMY
jgi:hypothetical protein